MTVSASGGPMSDERPPTPDEVAAMHLNVGRRLTGLVEIARKMGDDPEWIADKAWLVGTASDVTDYIEMAVEAASRLRAVLTQHAAERDALQRLADVTGNYLLWAPREKGHADAHKRLWDAYLEYEAFCEAQR